MIFVRVVGWVMGGDVSRALKREFCCASRRALWVGMSLAR